MVNLLSGYRFLFITAAIVSFLPIVSANAKPNNLGTPCNVAKSLFTYNDSKKYTISNKNHTFSVFPQDDLTAVVSIEKAGTVLNLLQMNIMAGKAKQSFLYSASVKDDGKLVLTNSNIKDMSGFRVQNGQVVMNRGKIEGSSQAVCAEGKETDIALVNVNIDIVSDDLNVKGSGFFSSSDAFVRMSGSNVTFNGVGAFSTQFGGRYLIDTTHIQGKGKKYTIVVDDESIDEFPGAFDISQGGNVHLRGDSIQLTDMHGFLITNFAGYADAEGKLIQEYASSNAFKKTNIKIERAEISVQGEGVYGLYFYGLDPDVWDDVFKVGSEKLSKVEKIVLGEASLHLSQTTFSVPDGIAIYSTGDDIYGAEATIELTERTKISGDLLLKAQNSSSLLVKAKDSILTGGIHVEDASTVHLELTHSSSWYLTKKKHKDLQESFPVDSSLSSISISDSTIFFDKVISQGYQTLYIGKVYIEKGSDLNDLTSIDGVQEAYNAKGNVQIKMSASVNNDGSFNPQKTDRILIYGNVLGSTLLVMENFSKSSEKEAASEGSSSISLVQVAGMAEESSFKLHNNYITINGLPYQYHLRAYGPSSSLGKADPKNRLVTGSEDFWDFRLEGVYINPKSDSSESKSTSISSLSPTLLPSPPESETIPSEPLAEHSLPTSSPSVQSPSVEVVSVPSKSSLSEGSLPTDSLSPSSIETNSSFVVSSTSVDSSLTDSTTVPTTVESMSSGSEPSSSIVPLPMDSVSFVPVPDDLKDSGSAQPISALFSSVETSTKVLSSTPSVSVDTSSTPSTSSITVLPSVPTNPVTLPSKDSVSTVPTPVKTRSYGVELSTSVDPLLTDSALSSFIPTVPENPSADEVLPSEPSVPVSSSSTDSVVLPSEPVESKSSEHPSAPTVLENSASVQPTAASFVSGETSMEEVLLSESSVPVSSSSTDSVVLPSEPVESKSSEHPSAPTVSDNPSAVPMPAPFVSVETSTDEVMPSKPSVPVSPSSTDSVSPPSAPVEPKPSESSEALDPSSNLSIPLDVPPELGIRAVVPQLPTYLLLPNALFYVGLMDTTTQNKTLETMRNAFHSSWKENEKTAFFLHAYGGSHHYASNLSAFEYGYGAELDYNALEAGVLLNEIESLYTRIFFGALGNYGNLSLHPQDVEQSKK
ncbi:autotransporter outer membrane beta-barrel domain-containing protein, partial [Bartonella sp. AC151YNML]|uniref:autotransporter outer membrane beta-barrel domain-containing protein n=1 Tax=Bartonella sp. AC151YNML TaxID=3243449 RepID=UPI0035D0D905